MTLSCGDAMLQASIVDIPVSAIEVHNLLMYMCILIEPLGFFFTSKRALALQHNIQLIAQST